MIPISVPCHRTTMRFLLPEANYLGTFVAHGEPAVDDPAAEVRRALAQPIGSPRLAELAENAKTCVIICSDHTRPVPSRYIIPAMLAELRHGNPTIDVTLLVATGCHRETTREELVGKFGPDIVEREKIAVHDCGDTAMVPSRSEPCV